MSDDDEFGYLQTSKPCGNFLPLALLLMPYALIRYAIDSLRGNK